MNRLKKSIEVDAYLKNGQYIPGIILIKLISIFVLIIGVCETFVGLKPFLFKTSVDISFHFVGAFWAGLYALIPGAFGAFDNDRSHLPLTLFFGLSGFCVMFFGAVVDGTALATIRSMKACSHADGVGGNMSLPWWGNHTYAFGAR